MAFYSRGHYRMFRDTGPDSPEVVAERIKRRKVGEQVNAERLVKFPTLTPENWQEAIDWQEARIKELMK